VRVEIPERSRSERQRQVGPGALRCRRKFLRFFPEGFRDAGYLETERDYKWQSHLRWHKSLGAEEFAALLRAGRHDEIAARAVRVEQRSRYSMLFSFEKMALRDALKSPSATHTFAQGLFAFLHGTESLQLRFEARVNAITKLPRKQTRVLTWPLVTVFGFIAQPQQHIFMKPNALGAAARAYDFDLEYQSRPNWATYSRLLDLGARVRSELRDLRPRDMIDIQSFLWVQGSAEYDE
jgi:hypothetical protein